MAIYQPTNITPSTFLGTSAGVIDADDNVSISWQVNGTSAMVGYSVAIYRNTSSSTLVHTFNSPNDFQPFYGTDAQGNPVFFILEPGVTWASAGLSNGNSYKLKITQFWKNNPGDSGEAQKQTQQNSDVIFVARAKPSVSVSPGSGTLSSVSQTFTGAYAQAQNDALAWVRWVLSDSEGNILDDTGTIYTGVLSYTYDGFFSGQTYTLKCTVQTSSGAEVSTTNSYAVSYDTAEQGGGISISCNADDSVTLSWAAGADIPGVPSALDYGTLSGGVLHLAAERSIEWATVNGKTMAFFSPYCFAWKGRIGENVTETETVTSGTWELWKTYPESRNTTESHTMSTSAWRTNPSASTTGTRTMTVDVAVSPHTERTETLTSTQSTLNTIVGGIRTYKTGSPCIVSSFYDIIDFGDFTAAYMSDGGQWVNLPDALTTSQTIDSKTRAVTVYTSEDAAYGKQIIVAVDITYATLYVGSANVSPVSGDTGISDPVITYQDSDVTNASVSYSSYQNRFSVSVWATSGGTHRIGFSYKYTITANNAYMASWGGTLPVSTGTLTSASIVSTTATGGATVSVNGNTYTVTEYNANNTTATQTTIRLTYTVQVTGSDSYRSVVTVTHTGADSISIQSTTAQRATIDGGVNGVYTVTMYAASDAEKTAIIAFNSSRPMEMDDILVLSDGTREASLNVTNGDVALSFDGVDAASVSVPAGAWYMLAVVRVGVMEVAFFRVNGGAVSNDSATFTPALPTPVSSVVLNGEQWCEYVYISQNPSFAFSGSADPDWNSDTLFYASFTQDLQAGTVGADDTMSVAIYRREGMKLSPIGVFDTGVKTVRDYAIRSGVECRYDLFYITQTSGGPVYSAGAASSVLCRQFRQHTLIEAEEDVENPGVYHPVNVWRFRDNVDAGGYTNQNQPVLLKNFTKYPLWQPSSPAAKTGTLTALLGWFENGTYSGDNAAAMEALFALSESMKPLFYRDMKGNLYMVRLSGPITQTIDNSSASLPVSVSVPWVEVGDADGVRIYTEG